MTTPQVKAVLEQMVEMGTMFLTLTGGEPLLRLDFPEIYRHAQRLGLNNVAVAACDWLDGLGRADMIVSNPPYIAPHDPHLDQGDPRFEPRAALVAQDNGLAALDRLIRQAPAHLLADGWLLLEHGYDQAGEVGALLARAGYAEIFTQSDYHGQPRVSGGRRGNKPGRFSEPARFCPP